VTVPARGWIAWRAEAREAIAHGALGRRTGVGSRFTVHVAAHEADAVALVSPQGRLQRTLAAGDGPHGIAAIELSQDEWPATADARSRLRTVPKSALGLDGAVETAPSGTDRR